VPVKTIVKGEAVASLTIEMLPEEMPADVGVNFAVIDAA
jgi:hypothetical protein